MILQIVQPLYGGVGNMGGIVPRGDAQIHLGPKLNVSSYPFHVSGLGRGSALPMNAAIPFQDQTVIAHGGFHIPSQLFGETHHGPGPKLSGRTYRVRGRGRGRGKGRVLRKHAAAPVRDLQGKSDIQGASQPMAVSGASSSGQNLVSLQGPAQSSSVLPPPKAVSCEICKVECNTLEILQQHMNGKKHKKKLKVMEELQNLNKRRVISRQTEQTSTVELKAEEIVSQPDPVEVLPSPEINEESKVAGEKRKVEEVEPPPQASAKKTRVGPTKRKLRGGKSNRKMRPCDRSKSSVQPPKPKEVAPAPLVCELCNVKCESVVVFQSHLAGKKHKAKAKRFMGQQTFGQELLQLQRPAMQAVDQNNGGASSLIGFRLYEQGLEQADSCRASLDGGGSTLEQNVVSVSATQPPN